MDVVVCFLVRGITAQCDSGGCDNHALSAYNTIAWAGAILGGVLVVAGYALSRRGETESARVALITALYCFTTSVALVV